MGVQNALMLLLIEQLLTSYFKNVLVNVETLKDLRTSEQENQNKNSAF